MVQVFASGTLNRSTSYFCSECGAHAFLKAGDINVPHFAHYSWDTRAAGCPFRSAPSDTQVGAGQFLVSQRRPAPIHEAKETVFTEASSAFSRAAHLKFWLKGSRDRNGKWTFSFALGLPQLGVDTPGLENLHELSLGLSGIELAESLAWRLWPGAENNPLPVPLREEYGLEVDPHWPDTPLWRKEPLQLARLRLQPEGNAFLLDSGEKDLNARLVDVPVGLGVGSRVLNLTQDPVRPPESFLPSRLGTYQAPGQRWEVWDLTIPTVEALTSEGLAWLQARAWHLAQEHTVLIASPPPLGFEGLIPVYPPGARGWLLMETDPALAPTMEPKTWLMPSPALETRLVLPEGRAPGKAICRPIPEVWSDLPYPQLVLLRDGEPLEALSMTGQNISRALKGLDLRDLTWEFRSVVPLKVLAGSPGELVPLAWQEQGRLQGLEGGIQEAITAGNPYQVLVRAPGLPRMFINFVPQDQPLLKTTQPRSYHGVLRRRAGWPAYTL